MGSAATPWAGTGGNLGPLAPAAHDEGVVTDMDVETGMSEGASDEPVAANDPEFDDDDDEAMMRNSVEAHVKTAATRLSLIRAPCPLNDVQMGSLVARFGHVLTADQERAIADVTADMTAKDHPMDRLVCGDVGYGKTEVAVHAIYLAACAGRQSALLVPSIVVAGLHADALRARLPTEVCIEVLTRKTKLETLLRRVEAGAVSVVVGTSALLSPALTFKNLGLLVVDEEQRFGVAQKEVWKTRAPSIDVLTLTATPIPRTMYMCMRGIRDMSLLTTPPAGRLPILTHVGARDDVLIAQRIRAELARGGQVLYVDHSVNLLAVEAAFLAKAVPECRLAIAHRKTHDLEDVFDRFIRGEIDVLVTTTIVENGIDIPNVNTIIVQNAHFFGLAQLHQMRGRVGRAAVQAYAYLLHPRIETISAEAKQRLMVLQRETDLGSGASLAQSDLQMRGAGNLFGEAQKGAGGLADIGLDLYVEVLQKAMRFLERKRALGLPDDEEVDAELLQASVDEVLLMGLDDSLATN